MDGRRASGLLSGGFFGLISGKKRTEVVLTTSVAAPWAWGRSQHPRHRPHGYMIAYKCSNVKQKNNRGQGPRLMPSKRRNVGGTPDVDGMGRKAISGQYPPADEQARSAKDWRDRAVPLCQSETLSPRAGGECRAGGRRRAASFSSFVPAAAVAAGPTPPPALGAGDGRGLGLAL